MTSSVPFYNPTLSYEENYEKGPFGAFADGKKFEEKGKPKYKILGQKVFFPLGIPAGPLINGKFVKAALDKGFCVATYKTVRSRRFKAHGWPNVLSVDVKGNLTEGKAERGLIAKRKYKKPQNITNSFGVPSFDPSIWQKDISDCVKYEGEGRIVVGSFQGTSDKNGDFKKHLKDYVLCARLMKETGVKIMEANLSCPNEGHSNLLCYDIGRTTEVSRAIKNEIGNIPLIIKISYFRDHDRLRNLVQAVGKIVDGISSINTLAAKIVDSKGRQALPGEGRIKSGVCGQSIKWAGIEMTRKLRKLREEEGMNFAIIGVGGVMNSTDFRQYMEAGADLVESATGAMWNPYLAIETRKRHFGD